MVHTQLTATITIPEIDVTMDWGPHVFPVSLTAGHTVYGEPAFIICYFLYLDNVPSLNSNHDFWTRVFIFMC